MPYSRPTDEVAYLADDEAPSPPERVLEVGVTGHTVYLAIGTWEQSTTEGHFVVKEQIKVDAEYLIDVMESMNRNQVRWSNRQREALLNEDLRKALST